MRATIPVLVLLAVPRLALAFASSGAGDPTLTVMGTERPREGGVRLSLEASTEDLFQGAPELGARESRLDLGASWAPLSRLVLAAKLPVVHHALTGPRMERATGLGLGDAELTARFVAWRDRDEEPGALFSLLGGVKLPTGPHVSSEVAEEHVQAGTGSVDPIAGLAFSWFASHVTLHASAIVFVPTEGFEHLREGTSLRAGVTGQWELTGWLAPRLGLNAREDDRSHLGAETEPDTGGFTLFLSPGVVASFAEHWLLEGSVHVPVATALVGDQRFGPLVALGIVHDL